MSVPCSTVAAMSDEEVVVEELFAHSRNGAGARHLLRDHARATGELARRFAEPFGAGELAWALGLFHDVGKAECSWQDRLIAVEGTGGRVGGRHWDLGAKLLVRKANWATLAVLGHHQGLTCGSDVASVESAAIEGEDVTRERVFAVLPEIRAVLDGASLMPDSWLRDPFVRDIGVRLAFSALVDADYLDTAAHFGTGSSPQVAPDADMVALAGVFEKARVAWLADRPGSPVDAVRSELYDEVTGHATGPRGIYRLPAPTGSGKTVTAAGFAVHHAAHHGMARVIVAVPFLTITEQNAQVYRDLLGDDVVLEQHSQVEFGPADHRARLAAENWDAPFVVTTTVQLFDSLFGRRPARSRKLHRLANAVVVLDEVQALPLPVLLPILDALKVLTERFGTTVVLTSATQPSFHRLEAWSTVEVGELVGRPTVLFEQLKRVDYDWRVDPKPTLAQVADEISTAPEQQALVVVNTVTLARRMYELLVERGVGRVLHLSTRMCPRHRRDVVATARAWLMTAEPFVLVSTQLIEAGVDVDFPVVFRQMAPAESLQQAAGRANREGRLARGRVVVFDAADAPVPSFYRAAVGVTKLYFGPDRAAPDDLDALDRYYANLYQSVNVERGDRAVTIQRNREAFDFEAVADGPFVGGAEGPRDQGKAFRMIDEDVVPVVITQYPDKDGINPEVEALLAELADPDRRRRDTFRALRPYIAALPRTLAQREDIKPQLVSIAPGLELTRWAGKYDKHMGLCEWASGEDLIL